MRLPFRHAGLPAVPPAGARSPGCWSAASRVWRKAPGGRRPPAVGSSVDRRRVPATTSVTETSEFVGRVQAIERVALTARVTAFLEQRLFVEGTEVHAGDVLYKLERGPFEADVANREARRRRQQRETRERDDPAQPGANVVGHSRRPAIRCR